MHNSPTHGPRAGLPTWLPLMLTAALAFSCGQKPRAGSEAGTTPQPAGSPIPWGTIQPPEQVGLPAGTPGPARTPAPVRTFKGTGVVRSVNLEEGWFEIDHEEIEGYMAAMRMQWSVRDRSLLNSVRAGDRVDFTLEENNGSEVVVGLKKSPPAP